MTEKSGSEIPVGVPIFEELDKNGVFYPGWNLIHDSEVSRGFNAWTKYHIGKVNAAQYLSPKRVAKLSTLRDTTHYNLCGPLSVIAAMGVALRTGFAKFAGLPGGTEILNNNMGTTGYHLISLLNILAPGRFKKIDLPRNTSALDSFLDLRIALSDGSLLLPLVTIDPTQAGKLVPYGTGSRNVAHWVYLLRAARVRSRKLIRVYNPYMNREEIYDFETFRLSNQQTPGNTSRFLMVQTFEN